MPLGAAISSRNTPRRPAGTLRMRALVLFVLAAVLLPAQARLAPIDHTTRDYFFPGYVRQLKEAVTKRNPKALKKLVADDVIVADKPERKGWKEFLAKWRPEDPQSPLWDALLEMLDVGFVQEHSTIFLSPYFVWRFPQDLDPARHWVVSWTDEALRAAPDPRSPVLAKLDFEVVRRVSQQDRWLEVETLKGQRGFVARATAKDPTQPRAQFNFDKGQWLLVMLVD